MFNPYSLFSSLENNHPIIQYSLIIPIFNEEESLLNLMKEITQTMQGLEKPYEIIFVNDGSSDRSLAVIQEFKKKSPDQIRIINLAKRQGQTFALRKGLETAKGNIAITLDADLQNDPADIIKLLDKMKEGYDVVCGWRKNREDKPLKVYLSTLGNRLQRILTGLEIHDISCTLRAYQRECLSKISLNWEGQHRFIPLSLALQGYKIGEIEVTHRKRKFGYSKYSHYRILKVVRDFFRILIGKGR